MSLRQARERDAETIWDIARWSLDHWFQLAVICLLIVLYINTRIIIGNQLVDEKKMAALGELLADLKRHNSN